MLSAKRSGDVTQFLFVGRIFGLPVGPTHTRMTLSPGRRIDIRMTSSLINAPGRLLTTFSASFDCTPVGDSEDGGPDQTTESTPQRTRVVRTLNFDLKGPLQRADSWLRGRLEPEVDHEMDQLTAFFSRVGASSTDTPG